ncbi:MAG: hypothetical protein M1833_005957 [Piccolia ochrophora]|nr:MAG: hypothetical protein M1833_005957 [Piccolia ochrophora]
MTNVSPDLVWELCRSNNAYLVKRKTGGGVQFSRDPLNLTNKHSRKYDGFVNEKAFGLAPGEKGGVTLKSKKVHSGNKPGSGSHEVTWGQNKSNRKTYRGIANNTAKQNYRADLRAEAIARASAIRRSQRPVKDEPEKKPRGAKARKAAETKSS